MHYSTKLYTKLHSTVQILIDDVISVAKVTEGCYGNPPYIPVPVLIPVQTYSNLPNYFANFEMNYL